ncbi:MAG: HAD family hydrolase [Acidobacteria bacterium]|nr:MAG: HAD family hydrolase [Acidobacteriota bacterium]
MWPASCSMHAAVPVSSLSLSAPVFEPAIAAAVCRHCGDACLDRPVVTEAGTFCCAGCESVFGLIAEHGLSAFYTCDINPGVSQRAASTRDPQRFAAFDDPAVAARFMVSRGDRAEVTLPVPAMHCASCLWLLEQLWRFHPGILRSEASLLRRTVSVEFRPEAISLRQLAEQLAALGYEPVVDQEPPGRTPLARRHLYLRIGFAGFAFGNVMLFSIPRYVNGAPLDPEFQTLFGWLNIAFSLPVLGFSAWPYFTSAWSALRARAITLDVPIALGLAVLFGRSLVEVVTRTGEGFFDSFAGLVFFLLIGKLFQQKAFDALSFDRTMKSFLPLSVRAGRGDDLRVTPIHELRPGDEMVLRPGEVVPADAVLVDASGAVDFAFVTGEQDPVNIERGSYIQAGGRVAGRAIRLTVARAVSTSRLAELWSHPVFSTPKPHWLTGLLTAFGRWFTFSAIALAALGAALWWPDGRKAAEVATAVLIIACPCAFTLAAPITLGTAMGVLGRAGFFLKNPETALDLSRVDELVFDKTGTLTLGAATAAVRHDEFTDEEWRWVRRLAAESVHPVSRAIAGAETPAGTVSDVDEIPGIGIEGLVDGHRVRLGKPATPASSAAELTAWATIDGGEPRLIRVEPADRPGIGDVVASLAKERAVQLLSGDRDASAASWRRLFGDRMQFNQAPEDKLATIRATQQTGRRVAMIGDGLNDAAALAAADVGIAVSDDTACLVPACDAVIRGDRLTRLPAFLDYAVRGRRVIVLCFTVSLIYNALGLGLALAGRLTPLATAILMPISSLTIVGLSAGLMRTRIGRVLA